MKSLKLLCLILLSATLNTTLQADKIHKHGYWIGEDLDHQHYYDTRLSNGIVKFFQNEEATSIVDFGCGKGDYVKNMLRNHLNAIGYDGNPDTNSYSGGVAYTLDLSSPVDLHKQFNWVMSLECGEHLPKKFEGIFIDNLIRHCKKGILLSWAVKGQGGYGHYNEQNNDYIKEIFRKKGFINDVEAEQFLRGHAGCEVFRNTVMVFRKAT